jgi:hypothetical protein
MNRRPVRPPVTGAVGLVRGGRIRLWRSRWQFICWVRNRMWPWAGGGGRRVVARCGPCWRIYGPRGRHRAAMAAGGEDRTCGWPKPATGHRRPSRRWSRTSWRRTTSPATSATRSPDRQTQPPRGSQAASLTKHSNDARRRVRLRNRLRFPNRRRNAASRQRMDGGRQTAVSTRVGVPRRRWRRAGSAPRRGRPDG